jgi:hypothetical protein
MISDLDFEAFTGTVDAEDVYAAMSHAFRCQECGRLHVFWSGFGAKPTTYRPEER